jgi:hypothetical protein
VMSSIGPASFRYSGRSVQNMIGSVRVVSAARSLRVSMVARLERFAPARRNGYSSLSIRDIFPGYRARIMFAYFSSEYPEIVTHCVELRAVDVDANATEAWTQNFDTIDSFAISSYRFCRRFPPGIKRECGEGQFFEHGPDSAAAPATVSGEPFAISHWASPAWEGGERQRPASQETCRQSWSHASTLGGVSWW